MGVTGKDIPVSVAGEFPGLLGHYPNKMKTFVLFALTLCVAHGEMSRKLFTERGQRSKSRLDQGNHHRAGVAGPGRSFRQFIRRKFGYHKAFPDFRSRNRFARSVEVKEYGSGFIDYLVGSTSGSGLDFSSGSIYGSGFGSGSSLGIPVSLTDGIKTEESEKTQTQKSESSNTNGGMINMMKMPSRKVKRSVIALPLGSGDIGSGSSGEAEGSGIEIIEEVVIDSDVVEIQYVQAGGKPVTTSVGSGSIECIGAGCEQGSGNIEINQAQINIAHSSGEQDSITGEETHSSGMYAVDHQP